VGSANLTNRSMGLDTELNLTFDVPRSGPGADSIAQLRASLLAEHAGHDDPTRFLAPGDVLAAVDAACEQADQKLEACTRTNTVASEPLMAALFDPATAVAQQDWDRVWEATLGLGDESVFKRSWETLKRRLLASGEQDS
jgi:phosphatidylserine/phosphatidylglycerophosphate/cardiolipin synthase-like enzyme